MTLNLMTVSCQTVSLGHVLIDYAFGTAILITHGDLYGSDEGGRDGVRSTAKSGGYCAAKTTPLIKTLHTPRVLKQPMMPAMPVR